MKRKLQQFKAKQLIKKSGLFDPDYYATSYPDVINSGMAPLTHYVQFGVNEGRHPNAYFDLSMYLAVNPDIMNLANESGKLAAVLHFIKHGKKEIRDARRAYYEHSHRYFEDEYVNENADVRELLHSNTMSPFEHYIKLGCREIKNRSRFSYQVYTSDEIYQFKNGVLQNVINPNEIMTERMHPIEVPQCDTPLVSIIIPAYNQAHYTYNAIDSIIRSTPVTPYEIIVMDDNSTQEEARHLTNLVKNITLISNQTNLGFLKNCNKGASHARGKYLLFLNNDIYVLSDWLDSLVELIETDEKIGMVGSKLLFPDGRLQEAGGIIWDDASGWNYGRSDIPTKSEYCYVKEVDYISGASLLIRNDLWLTIGGFDERYSPAYYEDTDLAYEVRQHGYKVIFQPRSQVIHFEGISHGTDVSSGIKKYQTINQNKFYAKWEKELEKEHFKSAQNVFLARDRSRNKPHLLFVDHYIPHYDEDAGSKATFQYLKLLVKAGIQVHFIGDNFWYYPDKPYLKTLTDMGIEVLYGNYYAAKWQDWIRENGYFFDYAILSRPHIATKYIDIIRSSSKAKIIYFAHDLHFLREQREFEIKKMPSYLESSKRWKALELSLIGKADVSYFFSDVEKEFLATYDNNSKIDVVPLYIYESFEKIHYDAERRKNILFVGGFAHPPNADAVTWFVQNVWPLVLKEIPDIHFYIIGSKPPQDILAMTSDNITVTGYVSDEELDHYYSQCRLMVAPLRFGAGVKGKIVDALYHGMPIVTTSVGAEGLFSAPIAVEDDAKTLAQTVCDLYVNEMKLRQISVESLLYCQRYFSVKYAKNAMAPFFKEFR